MPAQPRGLRRGDNRDLVSLLEQGRAAHRRGERATAERLVYRAVDQYPDQEEAWLALAEIVEDRQEKQAILKRVLRLNPANQAAHVELDRLAAKARTASTNPSWKTQPTRCVCGSGLTTLLRCHQCAKPICPKCYTRYELGLVCPEHSVGRRPLGYDVTTNDLLAAGMVGLSLALVAGFVFALLSALTWVRWYAFVAFFPGLFIGTQIGEVMSRAAGKKFGREMQVLGGICIVVGALIGAVVWLTFFPGATPTASPVVRPEPLVSLDAVLMWVNPFYIIAAMIGVVGRLQ